MIYGLYLSAQGANAQSKRVDVVANNLANASTSAFKRDLALFQALDPHDARSESPSGTPPELTQSTGGVELAGVVTDHSQGPLMRTGAALDVAVSGPGFLRVSDGQQEFLTRNGRLAVDESGLLVTEEQGLRILSVNGAPVQIPSDAGSVEISADGSIYSVARDGLRSTVDQIGLFQPDSLNDLQKMGNSLYRAQSAVRPASPQTQIRQGYLEAPGVNSVSEMVELIEASRAFETNVNMVKYQDEALGMLLQSAQQR